MIQRRSVSADRRKGDIMLWFAVQEKNTDAWDYGSSDYDTACEMLKEQGCGLIAVIENYCCIAEYPYSELVCGMHTTGGTT